MQALRRTRLTCLKSLWHFGHQKVERPFCANRPNDPAATRGLAFLAFAIVNLKRMLEIAELA